MAPFLGAIANNLSIANLCCAEDVNEGLWNHDQDDDGDEEEEQEKKREVEKVRDCLHPSVLFLEFPVEDEETISLLMRKEAHCMMEVEYSGRHRSLGCRSSPERHPLDTQGSRVLQFRAFDDHSLCKFHGSLHVVPTSSARQCLNAAASVSRLYIVGGEMEETEVPIFLYLQVDDKVEHIFEVHMIQRMELLVLSTLDW